MPHSDKVYTADLHAALLLLLFYLSSSEMLTLSFDPMVVRLADVAKSWMVEEDRRVWEGVWIWVSSARYTL